jgi:AI-2 transport protein TqsA
VNQPVPAPPPEQRRALVPRFVVIALGLAALAYFLTFVQGLQEIIAPVFLGLNLMIVAYPLQRWLAAKIQRHVAAALTLVLVLLVIVAFFGATGWAVTELLRALPRYNEEFSEMWQRTLSGLAAFGVSESSLTNQLNGLNASSVVSYLTPLVANVSSVALALVTVITAVFFLSMDSTSIERRLEAVRGSHPQVSGALRSFSHGVRRYWVVATVFGVIVALLDVVALAIIGVPLIWAWGVLAFLTNYIPNIGFVIGLVPPALLALLDGGVGPAIAVVAAYSLLNFSIQSIVQPKFTGESVGVTPTVSFLSLLFWYWVLGWLGALLALPATLLLKALLVDADPRARWINALVSSKRPPAPPRGRKARAARAIEEETISEA